MWSGGMLDERAPLLFGRLAGLVCPYAGTDVE